MVDDVVDDDQVKIISSKGQIFPGAGKVMDTFVAKSLEFWHAGEKSFQRFEGDPGNSPEQR